jgi:hypothetical protein
MIFYNLKGGLFAIFIILMIYLNGLHSKRRASYCQFFSIDLRFGSRSVISGHFTLFCLVNEITSILIILSPDYDIVAKAFPDRTSP